MSTVLANRIACSVNSYWHDNVVCPSVCLSVCLWCCAMDALFGYKGGAGVHCSQKMYPQQQCLKKWIGSAQLSTWQCNLQPLHRPRAPQYTSLQMERRPYHANSCDDPLKIKPQFWEISLTLLQTKYTKQVDQIFCQLHWIIATQKLITNMNQTFTIIFRAHIYGTSNNCWLTFPGNISTLNPIACGTTKMSENMIAASSSNLRKGCTHKLHNIIWLRTIGQKAEPKQKEPRQNPWTTKNLTKILNMKISRRSLERTRTKQFS